MAIGFGVGVQRLGSFGVDTLAALSALPAPAIGVRPTGFVYSDPDPTKNGVYTWTGSAWQRQRSLGDQVATLTVTGGTANAITATAQDGIDLTNVVVSIIIPTASNTGAVTINGKPVHDAEGDALAAGSFVAGRSYFLWNRPTEYRAIFNEFGVISDIAGLQAALDAKADGAATSTALAGKADAAATTTALAGKAPLASPAFSGSPTAPTASPGDNDTTIATTAFVTAAINVIKGGVAAAFDTLSEIATAIGLKADKSITITGGGLVSGGGDLSANRALTVTKSIQAQAQAGTDDTTAMTPARTKDAILALTPPVAQPFSGQPSTVTRVAGTAYQNTSGKTMLVTVVADYLNNLQATFNISVSPNNIAAYVVRGSILSDTGGIPGAVFTLTAIVPPGHYYKFATGSSGTAPVVTVTEQF